MAWWDDLLIEAAYYIQYFNERRPATTNLERAIRLILTRTWTSMRDQDRIDTRDPFFRIALPYLMEELAIYDRRGLPSRGDFYSNQAAYIYSDRNLFTGLFRRSDMQNLTHLDYLTVLVTWPHYPSADGDTYRLERCFCMRCPHKWMTRRREPRVEGEEITTPAEETKNQVGPDVDSRILIQDPFSVVTSILIQETGMRFRCKWPSCARIGYNTWWALCDVHMLRQLTTTFTDNLRMLRPLCWTDTRHARRVANQYAAEVYQGQLCLVCRCPTDEPMTMSIPTWHWLRSNPDARHEAQWTQGLRETRYLVWCPTCLMQFLDCLWLSLQSAEKVERADWEYHVDHIVHLFKFLLHNTIVWVSCATPMTPTINSLGKRYANKLNLADVESLPLIVKNLLGLDASLYDGNDDFDTTGGDCSKWSVVLGTAPQDHAGCWQHGTSANNLHLDAAVARLSCVHCFAAPKYLCLACLSGPLCLGIPLCSWSCAEKHRWDARCFGNRTNTLRVAATAVTTLTDRSIHAVRLWGVKMRDEDTSLSQAPLTPGVTCMTQAQDILPEVRANVLRLDCMKPLFGGVDPETPCDCGRILVEQRCGNTECGQLLDSYCPNACGLEQRCLLRYGEHEGKCAKNTPCIDLDRLCTPCTKLRMGFPFPQRVPLATRWEEYDPLGYRRWHTVCTACGHVHLNDMERMAQLREAKDTDEFCATCWDRVTTQRTADTCTECNLRHRLIQRANCWICAERNCTAFDGLCLTCWAGARVMLERLIEKLTADAFDDLIISADAEQRRCACCKREGATMACERCCDPSTALGAAGFMDNLETVLRDRERGGHRERTEMTDLAWIEQLLLFRRLFTCGIIVFYCDLHCRWKDWPRHSTFCLNAPFGVSRRGGPLPPNLLPPQTPLIHTGNSCFQSRETGLHYLHQPNVSTPVSRRNISGLTWKHKWWNKFLYKTWGPESEVRLPRLFIRFTKTTVQPVDCSVITNWSKRLSFKDGECADNWRRLEDLKAEIVYAKLMDPRGDPNSLQELTVQNWRSILYTEPYAFWRLGASRPGGLQCMASGCANRSVPGYLLCGRSHPYMAPCPDCRLPSILNRDENRL
jgi:hypothetical protein